MVGVYRPLGDIFMSLGQDFVQGSLLKNSETGSVQDDAWILREFSVKA
jgi:hypothetical protein